MTDKLYEAICEVLYIWEQPDSPEAFSLAMMRLRQAFADVVGGAK